MDDAGAKLEARTEPIYHPVWGKDADELTLAPFTQNSGHPRLKLTNAKRPQSAAPIVLRRNKLSNQLHEQMQLAQHAAQGKLYAPSRLRNVKDKYTGERKLLEVAKRVRQWWFVADTGRVCLQVRYGSRVLELAKGKSTIEVGSLAELLPVLDTVKKCVDAGELDAQIEAASAAVRERFKT